MTAVNMLVSICLTVVVSGAKAEDQHLIKANLSLSLSLSLSLYDTQLVYIEHVGKDATNDGFFFSFFSLHPAQLKQLNSWVCAVLDETTSHVYQSLRTI